MTHYPPRRRRNPWFRRFLAGAVVLAGLLTGWLLFEPPDGEPPASLLGWRPRALAGETNVEAGSIASEPGESTNSRAAFPVLESQSAPTSAPTSQFKANPSLIVPSEPSHSWLARPVQTVLEAQIALAREGLSPGSIDGLNGPKTRRALRAFQELQGMPTSGVLDLPTRSRLLLTEPPYMRYTVVTQDLARLLPVPETWVGKSLAPRLDYETLPELVAEQSQCDPDLIRQLNQDLDWERLGVGTTLTVPNVRSPTVRERAASVRISLQERVLEAFDAKGRCIALFPCSIARQAQDRLIGQYKVATIVPDPDYTFDPVRFRQTPEVRQIQERLAIPPGPNNPVGVVWIGLDRTGFGIHGTPHPEQVGQAESLGCYRLTNWSIEYLAKLAWVGMPVDVVP